PSLWSASGGQPVHCWTYVLPRYCTSATPILLEKNPLAVKSRNRLKNATPWLNSGLARLGHAMSSSTAVRSLLVHCTNGLPNRSAHSWSSHARPPRIGSASSG